jgi:hypothetical protein
MKKVLETLSNAQGWVFEASRLLKASGREKQAAEVQKALRLLKKVESDLLLMMAQEEEIIKLLTTPRNP